MIKSSFKDWVQQAATAAIASNKIIGFSNQTLLGINATALTVTLSVHDKMCRPSLLRNRARRLGGEIVSSVRRYDGSEEMRISFLTSELLETSGVSKEFKMETQKTEGETPESVVSRLERKLN